MTAPRSPARLRLTVGDSDGHVVSLGKDELPAAAPRAHVRPLAARAGDVATGLRRFEASIDGWTFMVTVESESRALLRERAGQGGPSSRQHGPTIVKAPLPGRIVRLWVAEGDTVEAGQRLLAIEAMKMENEIRAPRAGTIASVGVAADDHVELGDALLTVR